MTTILPPKTNLGTDIGKALGQGFNDTFQPAMQQQFQKQRLQQAFNQIQPGGNFLDQLKAIAPELLSTPGGAQALSEISGPLAQIAQSQATRNAISSRRSQSGPNSTNSMNPANQPGGQIANEGRSSQQGTDFRNPQVPNSPLNPFPERTAGPTTQPEMTPRQLEDYTLDMMEQSAEAGKPISYPEARQIALATQADIRSSNDRISQEKQKQEQAIEKLTEGDLERAKNAGLITGPEDETVIKKLAQQARNAPDPESRWEYIRTQARRWEAAKNGLARNYDQPNPIEKAYRKITGSYKDKESAGKEAQQYLNFYRENGLIDEARQDLATKVGLGSEDIESWLFPFNKEVKQQIDSFRGNDTKPKNDTRLKMENNFPGDNFRMDPNRFTTFKDDLAKIVSKNPGINLISLRGKLNQEKKYAWQDISKALNELMDEKRFRPDAEQEKQMTVTNSAPLPGLAQQFKFLWSDTK